MTWSTLVGNTKRADLKGNSKQNAICTLSTIFLYIFIIWAIFLQADSSLVLVPIRNRSTVPCAFLEHILIYSTWKEPTQQAWSLLHDSNQSRGSGEDWGVISEVPVWSLFTHSNINKDLAHPPLSEASPLHAISAEVHDFTSPCLLLPRKKILHSCSSWGWLVAPCTSTPIFDQNFCRFYRKGSFLLKFLQGILFFNIWIYWRKRQSSYPPKA